MKAVGDEEVVSAENLTALTDLEVWLMVASVLKVTAKRIYYKKLLLFSGQAAISASENRTAMLYID